jgi:hypothetical protein
VIIEIYGEELVDQLGIVIYDDEAYDHQQYYVILEVELLERQLHIQN